jgi:hypothetical protein
VFCCSCRMYTTSNLVNKPDWKIESK